MSLHFFALGVTWLLVEREKRRRETRKRIIDSATDLVEKHGFDNVTVEDICVEAGISRRTFFNYMECKDEAVLGPAPFTVSEEGLQRIANTQSDNLVALIIAEASLPDSEDVGPETIERRRKIFAANPTLANLALARRRTALIAIADAVEEHFQLYPGDRLAPEQPALAEIHAIVELVQNAVSITAFNPDFTQPGYDLRDTVHSAAAFITDFARKLEW